jgi:hypothetical protein
VKRHQRRLERKAEKEKMKMMIWVLGNIGVRKRSKKSKEGP